MHSDLHQSGLPHLLKGGVRQEDNSFHTGKMPMPPLEPSEVGENHTGTRRVPPLEPPESAASRTGKMPVPPLGEEQILEAIASGDQTAADIARRAGVSILELAAHVCTSQNLAALGRVAQLHATQREMLLGKLKSDALVRLAELTDEVPAGSADEIRAFEVMRRACADLLRYGAPGTAHGTAPGIAHDNPRTINPSPPPFHPGGPGRGGLRERGYTSGSLRNGPGVSGGDTSGSSSRCTGKMPVPLYVRSNQNRIPKSDRRIRFDDAHPP